MQMGSHDFEGDDSYSGRQPADQRGEIHGETEIVLFFKERKGLVSRCTQVEERTAVEEKFFTLALPFCEGERSGGGWIHVVHGGKARECDPFVQQLNRLLLGGFIIYWDIADCGLVAEKDIVFFRCFSGYFVRFFLVLPVIPDLIRDLPGALEGRFAPGNWHLPLPGA